jgi:hypothetical protein
MTSKIARRDKKLAYRKKRDDEIVPIAYYFILMPALTLESQ